MSASAITEDVTYSGVDAKAFIAGLQFAIATGADDVDVTYSGSATFINAIIYKINPEFLNIGCLLPSG